MCSILSVKRKRRKRKGKCINEMDREERRNRSRGKQACERASERSSEYGVLEKRGLEARVYNIRNAYTIGRLVIRVQISSRTYSSTHTHTQGTKTQTHIFPINLSTDKTFARSRYHRKHSNDKDGIQRHQNTQARTNITKHDHHGSRTILFLAVLQIIYTHIRL